MSPPAEIAKGDVENIMDNRILVVSAADENYAMPLAVTVRSALDTLAPGRRVHWFIVDGGLSFQTRERLERSWTDARMQWTWVQPEHKLLRGLPVSGHVTHTTYARMLLPQLLPPGVRRVLYLDADLLVRRDLGRLWDEPFAGASCLACVEVACPCMDARIALPNYARCQSHLVLTRPIPNYQALGIAPTAPYFNSGVLLIDLEDWQSSQVTRRLLDCLRDNAAWLTYWDQYALNVVLVGRWRRMDGRWNQTEHIYKYPSASRSPLDDTTFRQLRDDPWIVHFTSQRKPWHFESRHPFRKQFWQVLDRTAWQGWRPETPYHNLMEWLGYHYQRFRDVRRENRYHRRQRKAWRRDQDDLQRAA